MSSFAFIDPVVTVNSVVLTGFCRSATLSVSADELDDTAFGDTSRSRIGGLKDWNVSLEFNADFAAAAVDATLWPLLGTTTTVSIKPTSAATSATNPLYSGTVLVSQHNPMGNSVGDLATVSVQWNGSGVLTRAVA